MTGQLVECTHAADLLPGAETEVTIVTTVDAGEGTLISNTATVTAVGALGEVVTTNNSDMSVLTVGSLPVTGFEIGSFVRTGALLLAVGIGLLLLAGRRREEDHTTA